MVDIKRNNSDDNFGTNQVGVKVAVMAMFNKSTAKNK